MCDTRLTKQADAIKEHIPYKKNKATLQPTIVELHGKEVGEEDERKDKISYADIVRRSNEVSGKAENNSRSNGVNGKEAKKGKSEISSLFQNNPIAKAKN